MQHELVSKKLQNITESKNLLTLHSEVTGVLLVTKLVILNHRSRDEDTSAGTPLQFSTSRHREDFAPSQIERVFFLLHARFSVVLGLEPTT
ncbi:hypothetical protein TNCV_2930501 [Trichonephila clavipes]|nr:hypothetical protein TNCV_2930501 [Trichonephila clavipes]